MNIFGASDVGMLRHENQDAFGAFSHPVLPAALAVVCDGMGGAFGGREAAECCVGHLGDAFLAGELDDEAALLTHLSRANTAVYLAAKEKGYPQTGTTLVLALAAHDRATLLWVGDSRAYLWRGGELTRLTRDHSYVQELVERGELTEKEARTHAHRNLITRAVGSYESVEGELLSLSFQEGDLLLLCSDGLFGAVEEKEIAEILSEGQSLSLTAHELISAANSHGGEDNITVLLLENTKENIHA